MVPFSTKPDLDPAEGVLLRGESARIHFPATTKNAQKDRITNPHHSTILINKIGTIPGTLSWLVSLHMKSKYPVFYHHNSSSSDSEILIFSILCHHTIRNR
jgi:hypothetical protein